MKFLKSMLGAVGTVTLTLALALLMALLVRAIVILFNVSPPN